MKRNFPEVDHQFDVWHLSKSITKKLTEKAKKRDCTELSPWVKSISNHLWWCAESCEGDKEMFGEKWISIVHHTANISSTPGTLLTYTTNVLINQSLEM